MWWLLVLAQDVAPITTHGGGHYLPTDDLDWIITRGTAGFMLAVIIVLLVMLRRREGDVVNVRAENTQLHVDSKTKLEAVLLDRIADAKSDAEEKVLLREALERATDTNKQVLAVLHRIYFDDEFGVGATRDGEK